MKLKIKANTQTGFVLLANGGCLDINYPGSKTRRARVIDEGRLINALCCGSKPVIVTWDE